MALFDAVGYFVPGPPCTLPILHASTLFQANGFPRKGYSGAQKDVVATIH